jgi:hypothetical protein
LSGFFCVKAAELAFTGRKQGQKPEGKANFHNCKVRGHQQDENSHDNVEMAFMSLIENRDRLSITEALPTCCRRKYGEYFWDRFT